MRTTIGGTDIGLVREHNQDRFGIIEFSDTLSIAILCDGMGGQNGGGVAAQLAVDTVKDSVEKSLEPSFVDSVSETTVRNLFSTFFTSANTAVWEKAQKEKELAGMGTTMVVALLFKDTCYIAWAGDSRAYLVNKKEEKQLTIDHTIVQLMVDNGEITKEEAMVHPKKHYITRAIGVADSIDFDFLVQKVTKDDSILLCSDGLYTYIQPGRLYPLVKEAVKQGNTDNLIAMANEQGGADNITAVIMQ